jgi:hypothetical protein
VLVAWQEYSTGGEFYRANSPTRLSGTQAVFHLHPKIDPTQNERKGDIIHEEKDEPPTAVESDSTGWRGRNNCRMRAGRHTRPCCPRSNYSPCRN